MYFPCFHTFSELDFLLSHYSLKLPWFDKMVKNNAKCMQRLFDFSISKRILIHTCMFAKYYTFAEGSGNDFFLVSTLNVLPIGNADKYFFFLVYFHLLWIIFSARHFHGHFAGTMLSIALFSTEINPNSNVGRKNAKKCR